MTDATETLNADLVTPDEASILAQIAGAPQTDAELLGVGRPSLNIPGLEAFVPAVTAEPFAPVPESWRACTGQDIQAMLKASQAGFVRTPGFTRADVYAFVASKGL